MEKTIQDISGYSSEELTVMQTSDGDFTRCEFVWTTAGESGDQVGRAAVIDDGSSHYVLSVMADAEVTQQYKEIWNGMFESFTLI